jgi:hypothetical protein
VREIGDRRGQGTVLFNMSLAYEQLGERNEAILRATQALEILQQLESPYVEMVQKQLTHWQSR